MRTQFTMNKLRTIFTTTIVATTLSAMVYTVGCNTLGGSINIDITQEAFDNLSDYNLFKGNLADLVPNEGLLPYDLNSALFTDYAEKARFVWVPQGKKAGIGDDGLVDLPVGSVLVKNFYYSNAQGKKRIIETRLLVHRESGWEPNTYIWNDDQTDAKLEIAGAFVPVTFTHNNKTQSITYEVPNKNKCKGCHEQNSAFTPIGPKVRNINKDYTYADGKANQLTKWYNHGIFAKAIDPTTADAVPNYNDTTANLNLRARAWLDINCAYCHSPSGPAKTTGLNLLYHNADTVTLGYYKYPIAAGRGAGDKLYDIHPGNPDNSILLYRINSTEADVMMPELGRTLVHQEGVKLIREWIASLHTKKTS